VQTLTRSRGTVGGMRRSWLGVGAAGMALLFMSVGAAGGGPFRSDPGIRVASGSTPGGDWILFARHSQRDGFCTALAFRSRKGRLISSQTCGWRRPIGISEHSSAHRGSYALGPMSRRIARVHVVWSDGRRQAAEVYPSPAALRFRLRFWVAARESVCGLASVRALDRQGRTVKLIRIPEPPGVDPGEPDPSPCPDERPAQVGCPPAGISRGAEPVEGRDVVIGPLALIAGARLADHRPNAFGGHGYKIPATLPAGTTGTLSVPPQSRAVTGLVYSLRTQARVLRWGPAGADHVVRFTSCPGSTGRTGWPGGIVVDRRRCVTLNLHVEGMAEPISARVPVGRPCSG
jgi:hypothetical protein